MKFVVCIRIFYFLYIDNITLILSAGLRLRQSEYNAYVVTKDIILNV